jgi:hypothetical protein
MGHGRILTAGTAACLIGINAARRVLLRLR